MERGTIKIIVEEDKTPYVEAELVNGTIFLTKYEIAKFFACFPQKIEGNLRSIFKQRLLRESEVTYTYRYVYKGQERQCIYYNMDVLIFLSYRIATFEAEIFRQFVNSALLKHLGGEKIQKSENKLVWYFRTDRSPWLS